MGEGNHVDGDRFHFRWGRGVCVQVLPGCPGRGHLEDGQSFGDLGLGAQRRDHHDFFR